ncbi:MAG: cytochrome c [Myxococcaceae bacterium]|nr:cytochrome c [Myxococcaceae bacterium]
MSKPWVVVLGVLTASMAFADEPKPTAEMLEKGKSTYKTVCANCHGEKGDGAGPVGAALNPKPRNFATEKFRQGEKPAEVFKTISEGVTGTPMVGYAYLPEGDRWALSYYVLDLKKPGSVLGGGEDTAKKKPAEKKKK